MPSATVLDSLDKIRKIDKSDMLSFCVDAPKHYGKASKLAETVSVNFPELRTIIVGGMGGSAIGGQLLKDWGRDRIRVPIEVCREYSLPAYANRNTLVFVTSYSGETEESLSVFLEAIKRRCMIVCVSSGGKLREYAEKLSVPYVLVPSGMAPRATLPYLFIPLLRVLEKTGLVSSVNSEVAEAIKILGAISAENSPEKPLKENFAKALAAAICGTIPVVYGSSYYRAVAQRFKTQFNENSKVPAKWEFFPELDHNEIVGWEVLKNLAKYFSVILIRDADEALEIRQRIEITRDLIRRESLKVFEVSARGRGKLAKMCSVICVGDFTSVYLAVLRRVDPTPVKTISLLKQRLAKSGLKDKVVNELERIAKA